MRCWDRPLRRFVQALLKGFDLYGVEVLSLEEHFREGDRQACLHSQALRLAGFIQVLFCQQPAPEGLVPQGPLILFRIGHPTIPAAPALWFRTTA